MVVSGIVVFQLQETLFYAKCLLYLKMSHIEKNRNLCLMSMIRQFDSLYCHNLVNLVFTLDLKLRFLNKVLRKYFTDQELFLKTYHTEFMEEILGFCNVK